MAAFIHLLLTPKHMVVDICLSGQFYKTYSACDLLSEIEEGKYLNVLKYWDT